MKVELLSSTNLNVADLAISKCYDSKFDEENCNTARMNNVANVSKHASTIEHLYYSFNIDGISRAVLQELARHRIASLTVKSTRYTLQELRKEGVFEGRNYQNAWKYIVRTGNIKVDNRSLEALVKLQELVKMGVPNDEAKYAMPEAYKTSLVWSINARSLQNFLKLRLGRTVLEEMYSLAMKIAMEIPEDHRFLYEDIVKEVFEGERKWMKTIS